MGAENVCACTRRSMTSEGSIYSDAEIELFIETKLHPRRIGLEDRQVNFLPASFHVSSSGKLLNYQGCLYKPIDGFFEVSQELVDPTVEVLEVALAFQKKGKTFSIKSIPAKCDIKSYWKAIDQPYEISVGKKFRCGGLVFKVIQLIDTWETTLPSKKILPERIPTVQRLAEDITCKICFGNQDSVDDRLVSPCSCSGSIKNVHIKCLTQWLFDVKDKTEKSLKIVVKKDLCKICHTFMSPQAPYFRYCMQYAIKSCEGMLKLPCIIIQGKDPGIPKTTTQLDVINVYTVMSLGDEKKVTLGRKADVKIEHLSISRLNTQFQIVGGKVFLRDLGSKYGTWCERSIDNPTLSYGNRIIINYFPYLIFISVGHNDHRRSLSTQGRNSLQTRM